jgi:hypothetical protein
MSQMVDRIEALENRSEASKKEATHLRGDLSSAFVEDLVLLRAACLDDWSSQKD